MSALALFLTGIASLTLGAATGWEAAFVVGCVALFVGFVVVGAS